MTRTVSWSLIAFVTFGCFPFPAFSRETRADRDLPDVCPSFCGGGVTPYVGADSVYLRYAPGSSAFDFLTGGELTSSDEISAVHYRFDDPNFEAGPRTAGGPYLCVTATANLGEPRSYTAWVDARCICACPGGVCTAFEPAGTEPPPGCFAGPLGGVDRPPDHRPLQTLCRVRNPGGLTLRLGPSDASPVVIDALRSKPRSAYYGCNSRLALETLPGPLFQPRAEVNGFVWVTSVKKPYVKRRPGRRGWAKKEDLVCTDTVERPECFSSDDSSCLPEKQSCEGVAFDPCPLPSGTPPIWACIPETWHTGKAAEIFADPGVICNIKATWGVTTFLSGKCSARVARGPGSCCLGARPPESCVNPHHTVHCDPDGVCHVECDSQGEIGRADVSWFPSSSESLCDVYLGSFTETRCP